MGVPPFSGNFESIFSNHFLFTIGAEFFDFSRESFCGDRFLELILASFWGVGGVLASMNPAV